ncbi:hypothetical protein ACFFRR_000297 [Megaselia abdita]
MDEESLITEVIESVEEVYPEEHFLDQEVQNSQDSDEGLRIQHLILSRSPNLEQFKRNSNPLRHVKTKLDLLLEDNDLKPWFTVESGQPFCSCCQAFLRGGKKDLMRHAKTEKHLKFLITPNKQKPKIRKPYTLTKTKQEKENASMIARLEDSDDGITDNFDECFNQQKFQAHLEMIVKRKKAMKGESDLDSQTDETRMDEDELPIPVYAMENKLKFDPEWNDDPEMNTWLIEKPNNTAFCRHCRCYLRIGSGKKDLLKHVKTAKHQRNVQEEDVEQKFDEEGSDTKKVYPRSGKFNQIWKNDPELKDWVIEQRETAFCKVCSVYLRVTSGKKDLIRHKMSNKHRTNEENVVKELCRLCLQLHDLKFMPSIWDRDKFTDLKIFKKIMHCTGIVIKRDDRNPDKICLQCADRLNDSYNFQRTCEYSEKYFDNLEKGIEMDRSMFVMDSSLDSPFDKKIKIDHDQNLEETFESEIEYNEEESFNEIIFEEVIPQQDDDNQIEGSIKVEQQVMEVVKSSQPNDIKSYSDESKVIRNIPPATHIEEMFICDICGNTYDKKSKLSSHLKNHSDFKPHQCEMCNKRFKQSSQLTVHMRSHTGEKPLGCRYCDRMFAEHSSRIRHERLHRNEKPYVCDQCGRAFTYATALKVHRVVHTGEKNFHCLPCGKSFPQKHNLTNHLNTMSHRNQVKTMELEEGCSDKQKHMIGEDEYILSTNDIMDVEVEGSTIIYSNEGIISGNGAKTTEIYHHSDEGIKLIPNQTLVAKGEYESEDGQPEVMQVIYI